MASYRRRCKHCGKWISLRQMPGGQWVAFEGYENLHNCKNPPEQRRNTSSFKPEKEQPEYKELDFVDIKSAQDEPSGVDIVKSPIDNEAANTKNIPSWVWWLCGILLFILAGVLLNL